MFALIMLSFLASAIPSGDNLTGYWKFNEPVASPAIDYSGKLNNMTKINSPTTVVGKLGNATNATYTSDYNYWNATRGYTNWTFGTNNFTVAYWFNVPAGSKMFVSAMPIDNWASVNSWAVYIASGGITVVGNGADKTNVGSGYGDNAWHRLVVTRYGSGTNNASVYVDNVNIGNFTFADNINYASELYVGRSGAGEGSTTAIKGLVDDLRVYNGYAWTVADVNTDWNGGSGQEADDTAIAITPTLNSPGNSLNTINSSLIFNSTATVQNGNFTNATIYVWYSNGTIFNQTLKSIAGSPTNSTLFNISSIPIASFNWNVYWCGRNSTGALCTFASSNFSFTRQNFQTDAESYETGVYDTDNSTFQVNVSLLSGSTLFSASLFYNGSYYAGTVTNLGSGQYSIIRTIDIPSVSANTVKNHLWALTFDTGSGFTTQNTTARTQNVVRTTFTQSGSPMSFNVTILDEETLLPIFVEFEATYNWFLGSGTVIRNASFDLSTNNNFLFYVNPNNNTFFTDSVITISNSTNGLYNPRTYEFNLDQFSSATVNRSLMLLNSTKGSNIIVEVKDEGLVSLEGYFVSIYRYYPSDNTYRLIESKETDDFGQIVARLVQNDVKYKFEFRDSDGVLKKTASDITIACRSSICIVPFVVENTEEPFDRFRNITNYETTLTFNNATNIFTFTWDDNTGATTTHRFEVIRYLFNGTTTVCNSTSTSSKGSLTCSVGSSKASYTAQAFRTVEGKETRVRQLNVKVGSLAGVFGLEGLFWSFILLMMLITIGAYSPAVGVSLYVVGFLFLGVADILYINPVIFIAELVIGVLFIWAFRS